MRAPAELGRLQALGDEAFDGPGIDELALRLGIARPLGVALGDVDALHAGALHQATPILAGLRLDEIELELAGDVDQRLLHIHETMPGLAPQQLTAVMPPGRRRRRSSTLSRSA